MNYEPILPARDEALAEELKRIARKFPRYGYRRVWGQLRQEGSGINHKRVYRVWKQEGLSLRTKLKRRRSGPQMDRPPVASRPNEVWAYDFAHDRCANGQKLKNLVVIDEFTRELLAIDVRGRINSERVVEVLKRLIGERGAPEFIRSDNGPEFVAKRVQSWLQQSGIGPVFIQPGKPWQNGLVESAIGKLRDECLNMEWFCNREEARIVIEMYRQQYNQERVHSSLGYRTPAEVASESLPRLAPLNGATKPMQNQESLTF